MSRSDDLQSTGRATNAADFGDLVAAWPWWVSAIVIVCASLMALGAIIALLNPALLVGPGAIVDGAARIYAGYLVSRNLAIAIMLVGMLAISARRALATLLALAALVQLLDAGIDSLEGRGAVALGVLVLGVLLFIAANSVAEGRLWETGFWRDRKSRV